MPPAATAAVLKWIGETHAALASIAPDAKRIIAAEAVELRRAELDRARVEYLDGGSKKPPPRRYDDELDADRVASFVRERARQAVSQMETIEKRLAKPRIDPWSIFREITRLDYARPDALAALVAPQMGPCVQEDAARGLSAAFYLLLASGKPCPTSFEAMPAEMSFAFLTSTGAARLAFGESMEHGAETMQRLRDAASAPSVQTILARGRSKSGPRVASYEAAAIFVGRDRSTIERLLGVK